MSVAADQKFTELIDQSRGIIYKVIRLYVRNPEDEKDLFQEILFQAWKSYPRFDGRSKFSTWLYRVGLNTVLTFQRRPDLVRATDNLEPVGGSDHSHERNESVDALYQAIRELNDIDRMIVTLHLDGYENEEISEIAGITKNHVAVKLHRIKETLTRKLKDL
ncbi:MAG: sigma-70 family RNA polymerase sigma factor [Cyclobacteriaceae bacterium]|jgi:RNA polymerase sigma-70 factor (ECF subfamily)|nr:sigma-70 family RNA polymerase sigma factor [Cyclobacteriaceae bacterium]